MARKRFRIAALMVSFLLFVGLVLVRQEDLSDLWRRVIRSGHRDASSPHTPPRQEDAPGLPESRSHSQGPVLRQVPQPEPPATDRTIDLPPSPPLPQVPPESNQEERKQAFGLPESLDHVVMKEEAFQIDGRPYTIGDIQDRIQGTARGAPESGGQVQEGGAGPAVTGPVPGAKDSPYYGVRIVRPSENVWKINFGILREYLARRQVILPPNADQPLADGRSSGVGRLLKFIESVVTVYNVRENRPARTIDLVYPNSIVVFFKISDLFNALDQLQPEDWQWIRYVGGSIRLEHPQESREILHRRSFSE